MIDLKPGVCLMQKSLKDHPNPNIQLTYGGPKERGRYHLSFYIGTTTHNDPMTPNMMMNRLGWVFDPERAQQLIDAEEKG